jgi:hypothetical protein
VAGAKSQSGAIKLPLLRGVFDFVLTDKSVSASDQEEQKRDTIQDLMESIKSQLNEESEQKRPPSQFETAPTLLFEPIPMQEIISLLKKHTGISDVKIDKSNPMFVFSYQRAAGGAVSLGVAPWQGNSIPRDADACVDPQLAAEALFNKGEGFRYVSDDEVDTKIQETIRFATGLVWRQYMLRAFDRAVSTKAVLLYARVQKTTAPLELIPVDIWPLLHVADWEKGVAVAPDGTAYWSIQAEQNPERVANPMMVSDGEAIDALCLLLHEKGEKVKREDAFKWLKTSGYSGLSERRFQNKIWPASREAVGLAARGRPGPKKQG